MDYETMNQKVKNVICMVTVLMDGKTFQRKRLISILYTGFLALIMTFLLIQKMMKFIL